MFTYTSDEGGVEVGVALFEEILSHSDCILCGATRTVTHLVLGCQILVTVTSYGLLLLLLYTRNDT